MPDFIVNAAAYTNVEKAEMEQDLAFTVNGHALVNICEEIDNFNRAQIWYKPFFDSIDSN